MAVDAERLHGQPGVRLDRLLSPVHEAVPVSRPAAYVRPDLANRAV